MLLHCCMMFTLVDQRHVHNTNQLCFGRARISQKQQVHPLAQRTESSIENSWDHVEKT